MSAARRRWLGRGAPFVAGALVAALAIGAGCAGASVRAQAPLCTAPASGNTLALERKYGVWYGLLVHGYAEGAGVPPGALLDCTGTPVLAASAGEECGETVPTGALLPPAPLRQEDLVLSRVDGDTWLAWVVARRYASGVGLGPVALVDLEHGQLRVRAMGSLAGPATRATLRLERAGDTEVLVAEGETCQQGADAPCQRSASLLPRRAGRFFAEPLTDQAGKCQGPGRVHLERTESIALPDGWLRSYQLRTALAFDAEGILAQEQLVVSERAPRQQAASARGARRAQAERRIEVLPGRLVSSRDSLWKAVAEERPKR